MPDPPENRLPPEDSAAPGNVPESAEVPAPDHTVGEGATGTTAGDDADQPAAALTTQQLRQQKLARIKAAVEAGLYDSDELLAIAMGRMMRAVDTDDDSAS